jgi:hypothetical protein
MSDRDSARDEERLTFEPIAWDPDEGDSGILRVLQPEHVRILRRLAAGDALFLLIDPSGVAAYDFGPDDPVPAECVRTLISFRTLEFHGAPGALVALRGRLTRLGRTLLDRLG